MQTIEESFYASAASQFADQAAQGVAPNGMSMTTRAFPLQPQIATNGSSPLSVMARAAQIMAASSAASAHSQQLYNNTIAARAATNHAANIEIGLLADATRRRESVPFLAPRPNVVTSISSLNAQDNGGNHLGMMRLGPQMTESPKESTPPRSKETLGSSLSGNIEADALARIQQLKIPPPSAILPSMANMQLSQIDPISIHDHDVLCGRGGGTNNHPGNESFRVLVASQKVVYLHSAKRNKPAVSRGIVRAVRNQNPPGRFLHRNESTGLWYDIGDQKAREKTSQALREGAPEIRRELGTTVDISDADSFVSNSIRRLALETRWNRDDQSHKEVSHALTQRMGIPSSSTARQALLPSQGLLLLNDTQTPLMQRSFHGGKNVPFDPAMRHIQMLTSEPMQRVGQNPFLPGLNFNNTSPKPVVPRERLMGLGRGMGASARGGLGPVPLREVGPKLSREGSIARIHQEAKADPGGQSRKRSHTLMSGDNNQDNESGRNIRFRRVAGKDCLVCPLPNDYARRLELTETVAQMTVNGTLTKELKAEDYRTSLYLDAGLLNMNRSDIARALLVHGETESDVVEKAYQRLSAGQQCHSVLPKSRVLSYSFGAFEALGTLTEQRINDALQFIGGGPP